MTKLSVNINKVATIRNARGGNNPDVLKVAMDCERFGAQGITVHPRPDERHIRYQDVRDIKPNITTELNIEGNPIPKYIDLVLEVKPTQVTLVPDADNQITSNHGWDTKANKSFLTDVVGRFNEAGIRTSIFVDPDEEMVPTEWNFTPNLTPPTICATARLPLPRSSRPPRRHAARVSV